MRLKDIQHIFHKELDTIYGANEVDSFFFILIEHYYKLPRIHLAIQPDFSIIKEEQEPIFKALDALKKEKPIQYVIGNTFFYGLSFNVNESVLIPRPETEELVDWIIEDVKNSDKNQELNIMDIGTGSGCIAITLAKNITNASVYAIDVSRDALKVATENAELNNVEVNFSETDILNNKNDYPQFNIVVSNPPYVRNKEKREMKSNVTDNEPHLALFVEDDDPLVFYDAICKFCVNNLMTGGYLYFEINEYLGEQMIDLLKSYTYINIELKKDLSGRDRIIKATKI